MAGRNLSQEEWSLYFPDNPDYRPTCMDWPIETDRSTVLVYDEFAAAAPASTPTQQPIQLTLQVVETSTAFMHTQEAEATQTQGIFATQTEKAYWEAYGQTQTPYWQTETAYAPTQYAIWTDIALTPTISPMEIISQFASETAVALTSQPLFATPIPTSTAIVLESSPTSTLVPTATASATLTATATRPSPSATPKADTATPTVPPSATEGQTGSLGIVISILAVCLFAGIIIHGLRKRQNQPQ
jgi:hypothetical protein